MGKVREEQKEGEKDLLTPKQRHFVSEYLIDLNASRAAREAGYVSGKNLSSIGNTVRKIPAVKAEIEKRRKELIAKTEISQEKVLNEYSKIAFANASDFIEQDENGNPKVKNIDELNEAQRAAISSFKIKYDREGSPIVTFQLHDKLRAMESLARHLGLFEKDNAQKRPNSLHIETLNQLLNVLPPEQQESLRFNLVNAIANSTAEVVDAEFKQQEYVALPEPDEID